MRRLTWRRLSSGAIVLGTLASYGTSLALNKAVAVQHGVTGTAVVGAVLGLSAIFATLALLGMPNAIPVWAARGLSESGHDALKAAFKVLGLSAPLALLLVGVFAIPAAGGTVPTRAMVLGVLLAFTGQVLPLLVGPLLSSYSPLMTRVRFQLLSATGVLVLSLPLVWFLPLAYLPLAIGVGLLGANILSAIWADCSLRRSAGQQVSPDAGSPRELARLGVGYLPGIAVQAISFAALPYLVLVIAGTETAGLFRAAWALAGVIWAFPAAWLQAVYLPRAAVSFSDSRQVGKGHWRAVAVAVVVASPFVIAFVSAPPVVLTLFYSEDFAEASVALIITAIGSVIRLVLTVNGHTLNAASLRRAYSLSQGLATGMVAPFVAVAAHTGDVNAVALAAVTPLLLGAFGSTVYLLVLSRRHRAGRHEVTGSLHHS